MTCEKTLKTNRERARRRKLLFPDQVREEKRKQYRSFIQNKIDNGTIQEHRDSVNRKVRQRFQENEESRLKRAAWLKEWRSRPEVKARTKLNNAILYRKNPILKFQHRLKDKYKMTLDQYNSMVENQNGGCAICGGKNLHKTKWGSQTLGLFVDHDHATNKVRGLLCHHCNAGIGHFKENEEMLLSAIAYLRKHKIHVAPNSSSYSDHES